MIGPTAHGKPLDTVFVEMPATAGSLDSLDFCQAERVDLLIADAQSAAT